MFKQIMMAKIYTDSNLICIWALKILRTFISYRDHVWPPGSNLLIYSHVNESNDFPTVLRDCFIWYLIFTIAFDGVRAARIRSTIALRSLVDIFSSFLLAVCPTCVANSRVYWYLWYGKPEIHEVEKGGGFPCMWMVRVDKYWIEINQVGRFFHFGHLLTFLTIRGTSPWSWERRETTEHCDDIYDPFLSKIQTPI